MKKLILGFAAIAMLASCSKNETIDNPAIDGNKDLNRISFQATTGAATRGTPSNLETLQGVSGGFEVIGIKNYGDKPAGTDASNLFDATGANNYYKYENSVWKWVSDTDKDWPATTAYPLQFVAAYPVVNGLAWNNLSHEFTPATEVAEQKDQLAASTPIDVKPVSGTAPLDFKHILSAIKFKMMSSDSYKVTLKEVSIVNVVNKNTYNYATGAWGTLDYTTPGTSVTVFEYPYFKSTSANSAQKLTFAPTAAVQDITSGVGSGGSTPTDAGQMMLVPQAMPGMNMSGFITAAEAWVSAGKTLSDWPTNDAKAALKAGAYIKVTYNMQDGNDAYIIGGDRQFVTVIYQLNLSASAWEASKVYTYTLYLGTSDATNGTVLDPTYKDDSNDSTDDPIDNPAVDPGKPVAKGTINFRVDVTPWDSVNNDIK